MGVSQSDKQLDIDEIWARVEPGVDELMGRRIGKRERRFVLATLHSILASVPHEILPASADLAQQFLRIAEEDNRAAENLFDHGMLGFAVYHIQQAVEKATKALCLVLGITSPESLKKDHRTPQPLLKALNSGYLLEARRLFSCVGNKDYGKTLTDVNRMVNNEPSVIAKFPFTTQRWRVGIEQLFKTLDNISLARPDVESAVEGCKAVIAAALPEYETQVSAYSLPSLGEVAVQSYVLGVLTFPHEGPTRYPGGDLTPEDYTDNLGIVQALPELLRRSAMLVEKLGSHIASTYGSGPGDNL